MSSTAMRESRAIISSVVIADILQPRTMSSLTASPLPSRMFATIALAHGRHCARVAVRVRQPREEFAQSAMRWLKRAWLANPSDTIM